MIDCKGVILSIEVKKSWGHTFLIKWDNENFCWRMRGVLFVVFLFVFWSGEECEGISKEREKRRKNKGKEKKAEEKTWRENNGVNWPGAKKVRGGESGTKFCWVFKKLRLWRRKKKRKQGVRIDDPFYTQSPLRRVILFDPARQRERK